MDVDHAQRVSLLHVGSSTLLTPLKPVQVLLEGGNTLSGLSLAFSPQAGAGAE